MLPATAIALFVVMAAPAPARAEALRRTDIPIALVLSGGVSLGAYEAGLSWAVVRFSRGAARRPPAASAGAPLLVAVTGASAGSINALLSAILWCSEPGSGEDTVERNLLHDVWAPVGLDGLLPEQPSGYLPGDALMSTRPLLDAFQRFEQTLGTATTWRRLRAGCELPIGLTVTRATAAEHEVGGLAVRTQRFALPWRLEVGTDGVARILSQPLGELDARPDVLEIAHRERGDVAHALSWPQVVQGVLASAAFPLAFRPRELCTCSARCPPANQVTTGTCEGPVGPLTNLSCPARSPEGEPLALCSHQYVDGGIFDNTPVGLSVDLTQSLGATQPLQPLTYVYIDPDLRRFRPEAPERREPAPAATPMRALGQRLEDAARLAAELVTTARTEDLSRTLRTGPWNVTTRRLLYETGASLESFATVARDTAAAVGQPEVPAAPSLGGPASGAALRGALARALIRCFPEQPPDAAALRRCSRELSEVRAGLAPPTDRAPATATDEEVVLVAEAMRNGAIQALRGHGAEGHHDAAMFADEMRIGAVGMTFLADEVPRIARGDIPEPRLRQLRAALLDTLQLGRALGVEVAHLANGAVLEQLDALQTDPIARAPAARGAANVRAAPDVLFVPEELEPVLLALAPASAAERPLRALRDLVRLAPVLQAEIVRVNRLARAADALRQTRVERALSLSSRFAPITGSQLGNFGAFLDRPFRDYDYQAGVYDASHAIAVALCETGGIGEAARPVRDARSFDELDLRATETQRCVGAALEVVFRELDVDSWGSAGHVFRMLARAELEASVGEADAARLLEERAWAWLAAPAGAPPDDPVLMVADVLLSPRVACGPTTLSPCVRELSFDEFLAGLRARGYSGSDAGMRALVDDPEAWTRQTLQKLVDRSFERELTTPVASAVTPAVLLAHRMGELWLRRAPTAGSFPRLVLDASTIPPRERPASMDLPRFVAHLVPYRLDLDVARGGVAASWLDPALWLGRRASIVAELTAVSYDAKRDRVASAVALLPTVDLGRLSIGAGPKGVVGWNDGATGVGALLRVSAFQRRFSVALGTDSFSRHGSDMFFTIGVADLNGAFFWLLGG